MDRTKNELLKDKSPINLGCTISWLRYVEKNKNDYYNEMVNLFIKEYKFADFRNLGKNAIEQAIDKATRFDNAMQKSFDEFLLLLYENMWENKHNDFFDKLDEE